MPVTDGQSVSAGVTNPAFLDKQVDDAANGKIGFQNTDLASGPPIANTQALQNNMRTATGASESDPGLNYSSNTVVSDGTNHTTAIGALDERFSGTTGHNHDGTDGNGPPISGGSIENVPLRGYFQQGIDLAALTGGSVDISTQMALKSPSTGPTDEGVVVTAPNNIVPIRQAPPSTDVNDQYTDAFGNIVYGKITESSGVWTLTFYVNVAGVETAYSFVTPSPIRWYYQELFNPMVNSPVYSELATIPSDNTTADVVDATTTTKGKVLLSSSIPGAISASGSAGTGTSTVANADHSHPGVYAVKKSGGTDRLGTVTLEEGDGITIEEPTPGTFKINAVDIGRRAQSFSIPNATSLVAVTFASAMPSANYVVLASIRNTADTDPQIQPLTITAKSASGFSAKLPAPTDSANYILDFIAYVFDTSAAFVDADRRNQAVTVASGVKTKAITFTTPYGSTNYSVVANMINLTDSDPQIQPVIITGKTVSGFTVSWPAETDSANYLIEYIATPYV